MANYKRHKADSRLLLPGCICLLMGIASCGDYTDDMQSMGSRVEAIEANTAMLQKQDSTILALKVLAEAIEINDYVTAIVENSDGSYTITFKKKGTVTLPAGEKGANGKSHVFGVKRDTDGLCYWTIDGQWLLDSNGNKIRISAQDGQKGEDAEANFPTLRIQDGNWQVWDQQLGQWVDLGPSDGADGQADAIVAVRRDGDMLIVQTTTETYVFHILPQNS